MADYDGGYVLLDEPLVRGLGPNGHTANDLTKVGLYPTLALDLIQETPWEVNKFILDVVNGAMSKGIPLGDAPVYEPINPKHDPFETAMQKIAPEAWAVMSREEKKPIVDRRRRCMEKYEKSLGKFRANCRSLTCAREMAEHRRFYFPHNMDFRSRIYPIPSDLTPQGNDFAKGMLRFSRGTRLDAFGYEFGDVTKGEFWMGVTLASHWGEDESPMKDRWLFAKTPEFNIRCCDWVDDPLNNRGWLEADAPFQFLAAAHEWVWSHRLMNVGEFISHLPGNLDGSCNGAQHLSIMSRDLTGATATNCRPLERNDLYASVGEIVWERIQEEDGQGDPLAVEWYPQMRDTKSRRKVVKRSVMTKFYGVTKYGIGQFLMADGDMPEGVDSEWDSARYMRDHIWEAIRGAVPNAARVQDWFATCAQIVAEAGMPLCWDTPAGMKITQAYRNLIEKRVQTLNTRFVIYVEPEEGEDKDDLYNRVGMDVAKMGSAASPNVVHSCDASHLQITVVRMGEAGIRDFSMIHDSFGCPFAQMGLMRDILRKSIVDMYQGNYLLAWKESVEGYSGVKLPDPPDLGEFDVNEILESEFFFS
jgi:DNA-directed RNA polymerase